MSLDKGGNGAVVRGWCPDAWRPMKAGDGLLVRVKPRLGRLTREQAAGLCRASIEHGNGLLDMTRRANFQIRGVSDESWPVLLDRLIALGLVDSDSRQEGLRNILIAPLWQAGDDSQRIALELVNRLDELPDLPGKTGFVIDAGSAPLLAGEPGDFRIERGGDGTLILRADGRVAGRRVEKHGEVDALIALARWFVESGGERAGRMARHGALLPESLVGTVEPAVPLPPIAPGPWGEGMGYGLPFGRVDARTMLRLIERDGVEGVRATPWRVLLVEGALAEGGEAIADDPGLSIDPAEPLLRVDACPGMPGCPQATVETRALARRLAPHVTGRLHVSGCAKGCANPVPAGVVLTGREGGYDLSTNARAGSDPLRSGLSTAEVLAHFGIH